VDLPNYQGPLGPNLYSPPLRDGDAKVKTPHRNVPAPLQLPLFHGDLCFCVDCLGHPPPTISKEKRNAE
jgi:hypothetical protein